ncbi:cytochrome P450 [Pseudorhizobium halotolerans]|uniref:Cytochrome P450 n=1 Tax=Pseudorhizobium halotolerans TaxID=1233081 RepID=A0ABM8PER0_9HYPH|nr:cytochrome P450 [Pseudorhizobium halotolerans]CAD7025760.1 cytochrome P450 [Pseudorhizobium halotolerans]
MSRIPRDRSFDSTLALLLDPYGFISKRCRRYGADLFQTRLLLRPTICMTGPEAAELFYRQDLFARSGAAPGRVQKTLFGQGGVQGLDGEAHRHRKQMFMSLMTPERIEALKELTAEWWRTYAQKWTTMDRVILYDEVQELLTRAVCAWVGVPLPEAEAGRRAAELTALFDYAGSVGPKHWWSRLSRRRCESWIEGIVEQIRAGDLSPPEGSAARVIATWRDQDGALLSPRIAAVELLNILRPTVAVAVFIVFAAHALHGFPACRPKLQTGDEYPELFVQEIRRLYPFFPAVMARTRHNFEWNGYRFPRGRRVMLDLYGTNRDARAWDAPEEFRPDRFRSWDGSPFNFIPQGGGDHHMNHRCSGEWMTIELMKLSCRFLAASIEYDLPDQDLRIDITRLPAIPKSRFVMSNLRYAIGGAS